MVLTPLMAGDVSRGLKEGIQVIKGQGTISRC
jgi:hypothetical protein